ncbi:MAG: NADH-ubiquinone oxidoreductase-F iron-sulfur binding region domain-containing protein [Ilumatobacter sp.]|uniref:NuoF family protein n=1 Tax=Ilumatobacter sp. TaxID=1967498 RepID=UPI00261B2495|nr:NuoF family protein [Ilumatobacter sp.]MDJ0770088.1 NADH-ubiquinone oxidoreductase-F iron-sulfur binding region domain-containing protein [Ilumatobacter sp.]
MATPIDLHEVAEREREERFRTPWRVKACNSTACASAGAGAALKAMQALADDELPLDVTVIPTGCMGLCSAGPLMRMMRRGGGEHDYQRVTPETAVEIVRSHVERNETMPEHLLDTTMPFFTRQERVVLTNGGVIDPDRIESYVAHGGYAALEKALTTMTPEDVVEQVRLSRIRGRGGAGYPTASKWSLLAAAPGDTKYVVANGDEGDPGAYMDRTIMEDDPHRLIEGIALAAYATGADHAYIYVRAEYPRAVERLDRAIRVARRNRLLGRRILDTDFDLTVEVRIGAGAFVCGEETALLASIEGRRGTPRLRPPYPTEHGLWGHPTMINNVETLANIAPIVGRGGEWFASLGTEQSTGTKVFALAGDIVNTGLIEVPMGTTLREIVEDIGGGIADGGTFKAAQTGGPSGGCIPAEFLDTPVDYDSLRELGSIMGSGGLIVMNDEQRMPDVARFFMEFSMDESCGKCTPCRAGTVQMHNLLQRMTDGRGTKQDLRDLEHLCAVVRDTSLCGLGQAAPNPVLSTIHYFRHEYDDLLDRHPSEPQATESSDA